MAAATAFFDGCVENNTHIAEQDSQAIVVTQFIFQLSCAPACVARAQLNVVLGHWPCAMADKASCEEVSDKLPKFIVP